MTKTIITAEQVEDLENCLLALKQETKLAVDLQKYLPIICALEVFNIIKERTEQSKGGIDNG